MVQFEIEIMLIGIWSEPYFLDNNFGCFRFDFLLFLFLLIKKLLKISDFTDWRISIW